MALDREDQSVQRRWRAIGSVPVGTASEAVLVVGNIDREDRDGEENIRIISARLKCMTSEDVRNRKWTEAEVEAVRRMAAAQGEGDETAIDCSDLPPLRPEQRARLVRLRDVRRKVPVSVRMEPQMLEWLRSKGEGHLTRINDIPTNRMEAARGGGVGEI